MCTCGGNDSEHGNDRRLFDEGFKAAHDVGVLDRTDDGRVVFPYDATHVDFMLRVSRWILNRD